MKRLNLLLVSVFSLIISCSNVSLLKNPENLASSNASNVKVYISIPEENISSGDDCSDARTAEASGDSLPGQEKNKFSISIYWKAESASSYTLLDTKTLDNDFNYVFNLGKYYVKAVCKYNGNDNYKFTSNEYYVVVNASSSNIVLNMDLFRTIDYTNGNSNSTAISLPIKVDGSITKIVANWRQNAVSKSSEIDCGASSSGSKTKTLNVVGSMPAGHYDFELRFYNGDALVYRIPSESINIANNCTTNTWVSSGDGCEYFEETASGTIMYIKSDILYTSANRKTAFASIYVDSGMSENGTGCIDGPFTDINEAVATAQLLGTKNIYLANNSTFYIKKALDFKVDESVITNYTSALTTSANFNKSNSYKPKLTRYKDGTSGNTNSYKGSMIKISGSTSNLRVQVKNLVIDGNCSTTETAWVTADGSAINNETTLGILTVSDCEIKNCITTGQGGAIYNGGNTTKLESTTISACSSKNKGNAIYNSGKLILEGSTSFVESTYLAIPAVYMNAGSTNTQNKAKICDRCNNAGVRPSLEFNKVKNFVFVYNQYSTSGDGSIEFVGNSIGDHLASKYIVFPYITTDETTQLGIDNSGCQIVGGTPFSYIDNAGLDISKYPAIRISSAEELAKIADYVKGSVMGKAACSFENQCITLESGISEIRFDEAPYKTSFTGIGTKFKPFKGTFDGAGNKIRVDMSSSSTSENVGFFGTVSAATIQNIQVNGVIEVTAAETIGAGAIVGYAGPGTKLINCTGGANVTVYDDNSNAGGIVGIMHTNGYIDHCKTGSGDVKGDWAAGGIIGDMKFTIDDTFNEKNYIIVNCVNKKNVEASVYAGGITSVAGFCSIINCYNTGTIKTTSNNQHYSYAGGIVGYYSDKESRYVKHFNLINCANEGYYSSQITNHAASLIGSCEPRTDTFKFLNCYYRKEDAQTDVLAVNWGGTDYNSLYSTVKKFVLKTNLSYAIGSESGTELKTQMNNNAVSFNSNAAYDDYPRLRKWVPGSSGAELDISDEVPE